MFDLACELTVMLVNKMHILIYPYLNRKTCLFLAKLSKHYSLSLKLLPCPPRHVLRFSKVESLFHQLSDFHAFYKQQ